MIRNLIWLAFTAALLLYIPLPALAQAQTSFPDVPTGYWAAPAIDALAAQNIISGMPGGSFDPGRTVTRGQFAAMMVKAEHLPLLTPATPDFWDVAPDSWAYPYVETAYHDGILLGIGNNMFGLNLPVSRQDLAVLLVQSLGLSGVADATQNPNVGFQDSNQIAPYALADVAECVQLGLLHGLPGNVFDPSGQVTRAQAAMAVYTLEQLPASQITTARQSPALLRVALGAGQSYSYIKNSSENVVVQAVYADGQQSPPQTVQETNSSTTQWTVTGQNSDGSYTIQIAPLSLTSSLNGQNQTVDPTQYTPFEETLSSESDLSLSQGQQPDQFDFPQIILPTTPMTPGESFPAKLGYTVTYVGLQNLKDRNVAVLQMAGPVQTTPAQLLPGLNLNGNLTAKIQGTVYLDPATGMVVQSKLQLSGSGSLALPSSGTGNPQPTGVNLQFQADQSSAQQ